MSLPGGTSHTNIALAATVNQMALPPAPDPHLDPSGYLRSIYAVRERSSIVMESAKKDRLTNFIVDMTKFDDVSHYVASIIKVRHQGMC